MAYTTNDNGIAIVHYVPASFEVPALNVQVNIETEYPFNDGIAITFTNVMQSFPLYLRVPTWADKARAVCFMCVLILWIQYCVCN